jgi:hypothetical protein
MMPPAPSDVPLRGSPLNARIIVSPLGMPPLPILTVIERCPCLFTLVPTITLGCGAGRVLVTAWLLALTGILLAYGYWGWALLTLAGAVAHSVWAYRVYRVAMR